MVPSVAANEPELGYGVAGRPAIRSWRDGSGVLKIAVATAAAAAVGVAPAIVVLFLKIAALFFVTAILQGIISGDVLRRLFVRLDLRSASVAKVAGISAGIFGVVFFHFAIYMRDAWQLARLLDKHGELSILRDLLGAGNLNPYAIINAVARQRTGHGGVAGWFALRVRSAPQLPTITVFQLLLAGYLSRRISKSALQYPSCPTCGAWLRHPRNLAVVPWASGATLADAIKNEDLDEVVSIVHAASRAYLGRSCAVARKHICNQCHSQWVDAILRLSRRTIVLLQPAVVSDAMVVALRCEAALPVDRNPPNAEVPTSSYPPDNAVPGPILTTGPIPQTADPGAR